MNTIWNRLFGSILLFISLALLGGCGNEYDDSPPVLNGIDVSENEVVHTVSMVTFEMSISDNNELSQAIVRIEPDSDVDGFFEWSEGDWTSFKLFDLGGNNVTQVFNVEVPDTVRGMHVFSVEAIDVSGNLSESFDFKVDVQNGLLPYIELTSINGQTTLPINLTAGQPLQMQGMVTGGGLFSSYIVAVNDSVLISADPQSSIVGLDFYPATIPADMSGAAVLSITASNGSTSSTRTFDVMID